MIFGREATLLIDLVNPARKVDKSQSRSNADDITELTKRLKMAHESAFVYLGFYVAFNTVQVISRRVVGRAEETST